MEPKREQETMCCSVAQKSKTNQQVSKKMKNVVPYYKLFSFADSIDLALMIVGTVAAIANGLAPPLGTINFGTLMNSFGQNTDPHIVVHEVSKVNRIIDNSAAQSLPFRISCMLLKFHMLNI